MTETVGAWIELAVVCDHEAVEPVAELFARYGYNEAVAIEEPFTQEQDGDNVAVDPTRPVTVRTYLPGEVDVAPILEQVQKGLWALGRIREVGELSVVERDEEDWANAWKQFYTPLRVSERFVVRPPWFSYEPTGDEIVLTLDPGMAFGTGMHPTTRLALRAIERLPMAACTVLDVGTGSAILAIAAHRLGGGPIDGNDIDPMSIRVARQNLELNGAADSIRLEVGSLDEQTTFTGTYDVVIANIIARVLVQLSREIRHAARPGGMIVLSGIIEPKEALVREAYEPFGCVLQWRDQIEDWVSLVYRAPG